MAFKVHKADDNSWNWDLEPLFNYLRTEHNVAISNQQCSRLANTTTPLLIRIYYSTSIGKHGIDIRHAGAKTIIPEYIQIKINIIKMIEAINDFKREDDYEN